MAVIESTNGQDILVDDEDFEWLNQFIWYAKKDPSAKTSYAQTYIYLTEPKDINYRFIVRMHRLMLGNPKGKEIDHIDGNGLNNRRSNMRICTKSENLRNQGAYRSNKSGYKGVSIHKPGIWKAVINRDNKVSYLGLFKNPKDAAYAYDCAARKLHGEFARLNFPDVQIAA